MDEMSRNFWSMAERGVLVVQHCRLCGHAQHPPTLACARCGSDAVEFVPVSGRARLVTWTDVTQSFVTAWEPDLPFTNFIVELMDHPGVFMPSDDIYFLRQRGLSLPRQQGIAMSVRFEPVDGTPCALPQFVPDETCP